MFGWQSQEYDQAECRPVADLTAAEQFRYVLMCIPCGVGYFAKVPPAKVLSEVPA